MPQSFSVAEWKKIHTRLDADPDRYGLPERRNKSLIFATFNIREFGAHLDRKGKQRRSEGAWTLLARFVAQCDLVAIQEVLYDLSSLSELLRRLGKDFDVVVSDIAGGTPDDNAQGERLAFVYNTKRVRRTGLASDISFGRSQIFDQLYKFRDEFEAAFDQRAADLKEFEDKQAEWKVKADAAKAQGKRAPSRPKKPPFLLPEFIEFIRAPHVVSFEATGTGDAAPYAFIATNAHLLYGDASKQRDEREREFKALLAWLIARARLQADEDATAYAENIVMFGDFNLDFEKVDVRRKAIEQFIVDLNGKQLKGKRAAKVNFPFIDDHPVLGTIRSNARRDQTYDQIALFAHDHRLPPPQQNDAAGQGGKDGYDYGLFDFVKLFFESVTGNVVAGNGIDALPKAKVTPLVRKFEWDVSDHMPIWIRLPRPHAGQEEFVWS